VIHPLESIIHLLNNLGLVDVNEVFLFLTFVKSTSDHLDGQWTNLDRQWRNVEGQWKAQNVQTLAQQVTQCLFCNLLCQTFLIKLLAGKNPLMAHVECFGTTNYWHIYY